MKNYILINSKEKIGNEELIKTELMLLNYKELFTLFGKMLLKRPRHIKREVYNK